MLLGVRRIHRNIISNFSGGKSMKNSHYVPKFILKKFSNKLCLYNVKTREFRENLKPEKAYCEKGFYDDDTENNLNLKLETSFAQLLNNKVLKAKDKIELNRTELRLIKKFLLISIIRSIGSESVMQKEKKFYDDLIFSLKKQGFITSKADEKKIRPFIEEDIPNETPYEYWMRTINVILDTDGSPEEIKKHPKKTYPAFRWASVINAGYLAFWDSEYNQDEFVITDIGMTSENEIGWNGITRYNMKKLNFLKSLYPLVENNEDLKSLIIKLLEFTTYFHENFQMFPISAKRMIVLISPYFKFIIQNNLEKFAPELSDITMLNNKKLYYPNQINLVNNDFQKYHPDDKYIYDINQLNSQETQYCNALFLDRIDTTLGFSSVNKVIESLKYYENLNIIPRIDYAPLIKIIMERDSNNLIKKI